MIVYNDIMGRLAARGWTVARIQKEHLIPNSTITRINRGEPINTTTIDTICRALDCQPGEILAYRKDGKD